MTEDQVKQIVIDIINEIAPDEDTSGLKDEIALREQMDLDSMDFLDLMSCWQHWHQRISCWSKGSSASPFLKSRFTARLLANHHAKYE